jgi:hypothetical protein
MDFPSRIDRRQLLTSVAGMLGARSVRVIVLGTDAPVKSSLLTPGAPPADGCCVTTRRLSEIARRNEIRREGKLPLLSIPKELRRMKQQDDSVEFEHFAAAHRATVWDRILESGRDATGNPEWRPGWMQGLSCQNEVYKALRIQFKMALWMAREDTSPRKTPESIARDNFYPEEAVLAPGL